MGKMVVFMVVAIATSLQTQAQFAMPCFGGVDEFQRSQPAAELSTGSRSSLKVLDHRLGATVNIELLENAFHMTLHGPIADAQLAGDFLDEVAFAQERQNLLLARR